MQDDLARMWWQRSLHRAVRWAQMVRRGGWFLTRPKTAGVHAIALTGAGRIILVTLSYADGWRLPGGGRKAGESPVRAVLRELEEEIGMTAYAGIEMVGEFHYRPDFRHAEGTLFVVRGVTYQPRWSLEVKAVAAFDLSALPPDTAEITNTLVDKARHAL
jgi:8-oxo-dGTP pyrophosphatase MutT (NUDIX family)